MNGAPGQPASSNVTISLAHGIGRPGLSAHTWRLALPASTVAILSSSTAPSTARGGHRLTYTITSPCVDVLDKSCVEVCLVVASLLCCKSERLATRLFWSV